MSVAVDNLIETKALEGPITTQITSVGMRTIIDKFTGYNSDATTSRTLTVYKVPSGGTAGAANIIVVKTLLAGETYTFPEVVGHILMPGGFLATATSLAATINTASSGRRVT